MKLSKLFSRAYLKVQQAITLAVVKCDRSHPTNLNMGSRTKLIVWLTACGVFVISTDLNTNFSSAISCPLQERNGQGTSCTFPATTNQQKLTFDRSLIKLAALNPNFTTIAWNTVKPVPVARSEAANATVDGNLYIFGGFVKTTVNSIATQTARSDVYNSVNNTWTQIRDLPTPLTHPGTAVDGRNIYIAGGYPGNPGGDQIFATTDVWRYNVDTNSWLAMPPLPEARGGGALTRLDRELHFFGGSDINRADKGDHWVLSLVDSSMGWRSVAPLPNPRNHLADAQFGGKLYAIGGQRGQNRDLVAQTSVHMWNPATDTWTEVKPLPRPRSHIGSATFVMNGRIIVAGGEIMHTKSVSDVTAYNPLSNSWTELTPLPQPRHSGVAGDINGQIFYATGNDKGFFKTTTYKGRPN